MKFVVVLFSVAIIGITWARPQYTTKYDNINLDEILQNDRLLTAYYQCLEGTKTCTKDGQELKEILPDALKSGCSKCNENQKQGAEQVVRFLIDNKADWWKKLEGIYDPEGSYRKQYQSEASQRGISLPA